MSKLFSQLTLRNIVLPNRIVVSPMCQYSSEDGFATDWHLVHLGQFAIGKAAAIIQEATAISPEGRISFWDLGIWKDEHIEKYRQITSFIKSQGSIPGIQLAHAGRKASDNRPWAGRGQLSSQHPNGWQTVAPSPLPFQDDDMTPVPLSDADINRLIEDFRKAAQRAIEAGYQIIEIHAAHGYLIHQFLSPLTNTRTDAFGGSFENRIRFLLAIVDVVRPVVSEGSLWVRISATDWAEGGWDLAQSIALAKTLKDKGVDVIDVSSGGAVKHQVIPVEPNYQVPFAEAIRRETGVTTGTVGIITSARQAENIIADGQADFTLIGQAFLDDPHFVYHSARDLGVSLDWPPQYSRAEKTVSSVQRFTSE